MEEKKEEISLRERLRKLANKTNNENINTFTMLKILSNNSNNNQIKFKNFSQLKSKILENHLNKSRKNLKNHRLNQIFDKEQNYNSSSFAKKYKELFNETCGLSKGNGYQYISNRNNKPENSRINSQLLMYINKIKKMNNKNEYKRNYDLNSIYNSKYKERKFDSNIMNNFYDTFYKINKSTSYNKINDIKKESVYKNINHKIRFSDSYANKTNYAKKNNNNKYNNIFRNNIINKSNSNVNNYDKIFNSLDYYQSALSTTNTKLNEKNNLFSIRKNIIDKKLDFFQGGDIFNNNFKTNLNDK